MLRVCIKVDECKPLVRVAEAGGSGLEMYATHDCKKSLRENFCTITTGNFAKDLI